MILRRSRRGCAICSPVQDRDFAAGDGNTSSFGKSGVMIVQLVPDVGIERQIYDAVGQGKYGGVAVNQRDIGRRFRLRQLLAQEFQQFSQGQFGQNQGTQQQSASSGISVTA